MYGNTWVMSGSRCLSGRTPSIGAMRLTVLLTTGATFQPAVRNPNVSAVGCGSSSMTTIT